MKVLVTGSSGMIGTALCERLHKDGHLVTAVDRNQNQWSKRPTCLVDLLKPDGLEDVGCTDYEWDYVIHLAANARVYDLVLRPQLALENCITTHNVLEFCRKASVRGVLLASSRECYGNLEQQPVREDAIRLEEILSPYAASKLYGEALLRSYCHCYGLGGCVVRFSNVYGPFDQSDRLIPTFIRNSLAGKPLTIYGREKTLDFTYLDDAVDGVMCLLNAHQPSICRGQAHNISSGGEASIEQVARLIALATGFAAPLRFEPSRAGEVRRYRSDIGLMENAGWHPKTTLADGIERTVAWHREQK